MSETKEPLKLNNGDGKGATSFEPVCDATYVRAHDFASLVYHVFKPVFADFYGARFEMNASPAAKTMIPSITLFFDHADHSKDGDDKITGVELVKDAKNASGILKTLRERDRLMRDGDRYYLTDDAKSIIEEFVIPSYRLRKTNEINWQAIVGEYVDRQPSQMYGYGFVQQQKSPQLTRVSFLSLEACARFIYGTKVENEDGSVDYIDYRVQPVPLMNGNNIVDYVLFIMRAHVNNIDDVARSCGWAPQSNIITA